MFPTPKSLRILLPVATTTTAAIITAYLIAQQHNNLKDLKDEDQLLDNVDLETKPFEEELIENKDQSKEYSEKDKPAESKSKDSLEKSPEDKKESTPINELSNPDEMVKQAVEKVAEMMQEAKGLESVNQMKLQVPDVAQPQTPSEAKSRAVNGADENDRSREPNKEVEKGDQGQPSLVDNKETQESPEDIQAKIEKQDRDDDSEATMPDSEDEAKSVQMMQEDEQTQTNLNSESGPAERESKDTSRGEQDDASHLISKEANSLGEETTLREGEGSDTKSLDNSQAGDGETGSDNESVNMTEEQIKQLLNWREEMSNYRGKLGALLRR